MFEGFSKVFRGQRFRGQLSQCEIGDGSRSFTFRFHDRSRQILARAGRSGSQEMEKGMKFGDGSHYFLSPNYLCSLIFRISSCSPVIRLHQSTHPSGRGAVQHLFDVVGPGQGVAGVDFITGATEPLLIKERIKNLLKQRGGQALSPEHIHAQQFFGGRGHAGRLVAEFFPLHDALAGYTED